MTNAARAVVTPELGLYRSAPLASRWADGPRREKCLYLALLPSGMFVRTLAPANDFDFGAYVDAVTAGLERGVCRVSVVAGRHFHHLGEFSVEIGRVHFAARLRISGEVFVQRWWMEVVTGQFLVGRGEVYRWYGGS
jgi:hypothetical protein